MLHMQGYYFGITFCVCANELANTWQLLTCQLAGYRMAEAAQPVHRLLEEQQTEISGKQRNAGPLGFKETRQYFFLLKKRQFCTIHVHHTPSCEISSLSSGQIGLFFLNTGSKHSRQKRCPHSVCTGFRMANRQMGHSCRFRSGWTNFASYPDMVISYKTTKPLYTYIQHYMIVHMYPAWERNRTYN